MSVKIEGIEELAERLDGMTDPAKIKAAMGTACALVERTAKQKAEKDVENLRNSITSKVEGEGSNTVGIVHTPHEIAPYIEFGTGIYAEKGNGRKEVPWVYVEGSTRTNTVKKTYTEAEADRAVAILQSQGLDARKTYGRHPAPFLRPALNENREEIKKILKGAMLEK